MGVGAGLATSEGTCSPYLGLRESPDGTNHSVDFTPSGSCTN
jgi:hypothetical protein